jgi:dihydroflavonol-4-reductase
MGPVLVTGGTGFIGRRLVEALGDAGVRVRVLSRRGTAWSEPGRSIDVVRGDVTDEASVARAVEGCVAAAHLAGEVRDPSRYWSVNAKGTAQLVTSAQRAGVMHILHMSSVGVMGCRRAGPVDESESCRPMDEYERSKLQAEELALAGSRESGMHVTVLRPTIVFGARLDRPDSLLALLRAIRAGKFVYFDRMAVANYVYVDDVVGASLQALERRVPGVFTVADPCLLSAFVELAADAMGAPRPTLRVPLPLAYAGAAAMEAAGWLWGRNSPLTVSRVRALSSRTRFESASITSALGWAPTVGWAEGLARTIAAYRVAGML